MRSAPVLVTVLVLALVTLAACAAPTPPEPSTPVAGPTDTGTACPPPTPEATSWFCVSTGGGGPEAEAADRERLARLQREPVSDEEQQRLQDERLREVGGGQDEAVSPDGELVAGMGTLLVRTDFAHPQEWAALQAALAEPDADGFVPYLVTIDHPRWTGATVADLLAAAPEGTLLVLADAQALTDPERSVLVVGGPDETMRVAPVALASVENNLSIATMDWFEFAEAVDDDGVFRGVR